MPAKPTDVSRRALLAAGGGFLLAACTGPAAAVLGTAPVTASPSPSPSPSASSAARSASSSVVAPTAASAASTSAGAPPSPASAVVAAPSPTASPGGPATEIDTGPTNRQALALTFHGGGDPATATSILHICADRGAKITVLAIGTWLQENPAMAAAIVGAGHDLGNHTWSHPVLSDLDETAVRDEITRCRDLLVQLTGSPGAFFRTSSGQHASPLILREAGAAGYPTCLSYDVDPQDWTDPGADAVRAGVAAATAGSIVSMHFGHPGTVQALPGILDDLAARGLQAVTATMLLAG